MADPNPSPPVRLVEQLFVKHIATIRGFIEALLPDFNQADDVLQECFLTVAAKAGQFRAGAKRGTEPICRGQPAVGARPEGAAHKSDLCPPSAREDRDFLAWVVAVARFKVLESLRQRRPDTRWLSPETIDALSADAPTDDSSREMETFLRECMEELAVRARQVIDLRYGEGCPPAEIARRLNWTPESVYVALSRARSLLRECIERKNRQQEHQL